MTTFSAGGIMTGSFRMRWRIERLARDGGASRMASGGARPVRRTVSRAPGHPATRRDARLPFRRPQEKPEKPCVHHPRHVRSTWRALTPERHHAVPRGSAADVAAMLRLRSDASSTMVVPAPDEGASAAFRAAPTDPNVELRAIPSARLGDRRSRRPRVGIRATALPACARRGGSGSTRLPG